MILVSVLIAIALDRMLFWHRDSPVGQWLAGWIDAVVTRLPASWDGVGGVLAIVLPPVVVMLGLQWMVAGWLFGLVSLLLAIAVLLFMLGPLDVINTVDDYIEARRNQDLERSDFAYERIVGAVPPAGRGAEEGRALARALFHQGHDHMFATLFWFCILGPVGAVFYRFAAEAALRPSPALVARPGLTRAARDVVSVLGWVPTRLLAFGYAMTGSFEATLARLRRDRLAGSEPLHDNQLLLADAGTAAMRDDADSDAEESRGERRSDDEAAIVASARALMIRAGIFWLAILALLTLAGWFA